MEKALTRAATGIAAQVVPRSTHSDAGVWCTWKGRALGEDLLDIYQHAHRLRSERRFEEALDLLFQAVRRDPGNGYLRYAVGQVQEELSLYLDALLTYGAIPGKSEASADRPQRRAARRIDLIADYRCTVLLGFGEALAEQWLPAPEGRPSRRSAELVDVRDRLRSKLTGRFQDLCREGLIDQADLRRLRLHGAAQALVERRRIAERYPHPLTALDVLLDEHPQKNLERAVPGRGSTVRERNRVRDENRRLRERRLHLFFQLLAEGEARRFVREYSARELRALTTGLTRVGVELLPCWAALRTARARHLLRGEMRRQLLRERHSGQSPANARKQRPHYSSAHWPPDARQVKAMWTTKRRLRPGLNERLQRSREIDDHYNAACIYAVPLLPGHEESQSEHARERRSGLAAAAVEELRLAAEVGGGMALAGRWAWILAEDRRFGRPAPVSRVPALRDRLPPHRRSRASPSNAHRPPSGQPP